MEIDPIFEPVLFSFRYESQDDNEYDRLINLWTNVAYLRNYAKENNVEDINRFINDRLRDAEAMDDYLNGINESGEGFDLYFQPLSISETKQPVLRLQKGKRKGNQLRLYAIRIDENCFVITGGAIKMSQKMIDHSDTREELKKMNIAKGYLTDKGVFDEDSFYEWLSE